MTCTDYGSERSDSDWTADEIAILEAELEVARKKVALATAKQYGMSSDDMIAWRKRNPNHQVTRDHNARLAKAEQDAYQVAHDRHFLRMAKEYRPQHAHANPHPHAS